MDPIPPTARTYRLEDPSLTVYQEAADVWVAFYTRDSGRQVRARTESEALGGLVLLWHGGREPYSPTSSTNRERLLGELARAVRELRGIVEQSETPWDVRFDLVFSPVVQGELGRIFRELGVALSYSDPDTSYEEDVCAYYEAVLRHYTQIMPVSREAP